VEGIPDSPTTPEVLALAFITHSASFGRELPAGLGGLAIVRSFCSA